MARALQPLTACPDPMSASRAAPSPETGSLPQGYTLYPVSGGFKELAGPLYVKDEGDKRWFGFRAREEHTNPNGVVHGGLLMTVIDDILSIVILDTIERRSPVATVSLNCDFLSPVRPGDWVDGWGEITRLGRQLAFVRGALSVTDKAVLNASGVWKIHAAR